VKSENINPSQPQAYVERIDVRFRAGFLVVMFIAASLSLFIIEPVPQPLSYHQFVDMRSWLGISNFGDVVSNLPFALTGGAGLWYVFGPRGSSIFDCRADRLPYAVFFTGVSLVSIGSAYYHLAPDNGRLVWDRLPMSVTFMALFSAFIADRIHSRIGTYWLMPSFICAGLLSVIYWDLSETLGQGDLRWYFLVQFFPILALPVICWLFPEGRYTSARHLAWVIVWYAASKALEFLDVEIFRLLGNSVSGHTLKHLASAIAVVIVLLMIAAMPKRAFAERYSVK
jgi:hypothetical protein